MTTTTIERTTPVGNRPNAFRPGDAETWRPVTGYEDCYEVSDQARRKLAVN